MNRFELLRYEKGATVTDIAEATGLAIGTLRRLESDASYKPSAPVAKALADYYDMSVAEILGVGERAA